MVREQTKPAIPALLAKVGQMIGSGLDPLAISETLEIPFADVVESIYRLIGGGVLRRSEVYFSFTKEKRHLLQKCLVEAPTRAGGNSIDSKADELSFFASLRDRSVFAGDMYEYLADIEVTLHDLARQTLVDHFGEGEAGWWRKGVPATIRKKCVADREEDTDPAATPFAYTTFIQLAEIIRSNSPLFDKSLLRRWNGNLKNIDRDLRRLNTLRNSVMHPVRKRKWSEDDFTFVREVGAKLSNTNPGAHARPR